MKRFLPLIGIAVLALAGAGVYFGTHVLTDNYLAQESSQNKAQTSVACKSPKTNHVVTIRDNAMQPAHTDAKLCDSLTIINQDPANRLIAFGVHDHHQPYDGVTERELRMGERFTITLVQAGTFLFHDHLQDEVQGTFTVIH